MTALISHINSPPSNKHMLGFLFQVLGCMFPYSQGSQVCCLESCMQQLSFLQISGDSKDESAKFLLQSKCPSSFKAFHLGWFPLPFPYWVPSSAYIASSQQPTDQLKTCCDVCRTGPISLRKHSDDRSHGCIMSQQFPSFVTRSNK